MRTFFELIEPSELCAGYATLPYIKGITEPLSRTLRKHNIKVCNKPLRTLEQEFPSVKHRPPTEEKNNVIYKIPCKDCAWNYIGETGRSLKTRKAEHIRNVKKHNSDSNIAKYAWHNDHVIDFDKNPWIWRENQRGVLIGFSYSEIRFLNKNIVKYLKINAIFRQSIYFFQLFFVLQHYR